MKQRVLIVDDDPVVRHVHARLVRDLGYDAETAADGVEALTKLGLGVDLVLLDLYMPHVDGFEVAQQIRADPRFRLVPIVIITGSDKEAWYPRALEVGANDVMSKPISMQELRFRTRWLMELKGAYDASQVSNERLKEAVSQATDGLRSALEKSVDAERRVHRAHLDTIRRLTLAAEFKEESIAGHLARVGLSARVLADAAKLTSLDVDTIRHAAPLHDVGMIGIPDAVLLKQGPLDDVERALVREHTHIGASLLDGSDSDVIQMGAKIALYHHEQWDGGGYPSGLVGEAIPVEARICAIVDYYDSSTMHRPYRRARPRQDVVAEMVAEAGGRFDPRLVDAFMSVLPEIERIRAEYPIED